MSSPGASVACERERERKLRKDKEKHAPRVLNLSRANVASERNELSAGVLYFECAFLPPGEHVGRSSPLLGGAAELESEGRVHALDRPKKTRLQCEMWEKWGATYGRNGWVGDKKIPDPELVERLLERLARSDDGIRSQPRRTRLVAAAGELGELSARQLHIERESGTG